MILHYITKYLMETLLFCDKNDTCFTKELCEELAFMVNIDMS